MYSFGNIEKPYYYCFEIIKRCVSINETKINIIITDIIVNDRFRYIPESFLRKVYGVILAYDITNRESFNNLEFWKNEVHNKSPNNIQFVVVGLKCELSEMRMITKGEGESFAAKYNIPFFEVSSDDYLNVESPFIALTQLVLSTPKSQNLNHPLLNPRIESNCMF